jgi:hypothetical protein
MAAMMRQTCKQILTMLLAATLVLSAPSLTLAQSVVSTIVTDPLTGVAMDGYDPVSYFTETAPLQGSPENEYYWGGVPWYFATPANRDVFMRNPDIYAPQHGGHCEMSLARGYLSDGNPEIYALVEMKLYLFYSAANREAFLLSPDEALAKADASWATLSAGLAGPEAELPVSEPVTDAAHAADPAQHP